MKIRPQNTEYVVAELVNLSPNTTSVLLLCWSTQEDSLRYYAINDSILDADYNSWLMVNTSSKAVGLRVGEDAKPIFLKPGSIEKHKVGAKKNVGVPVLGRSEFNGNIKTFYSTYWQIRDNERSIVIFVERGKKIKVMRIGGLDGH